MLSRHRRRPGDVDDVVEQLKGHADSTAERDERHDLVGRGLSRERAELAGRLEQAGRLQLAAQQVALDRNGRVPGVLALQQLALGERRRRARQRLHRRQRAGGGELGERAREEQVAGRDRKLPPAPRPDRRHAAAQARAVEHVVVDERRAVDQLDRGGGGDQLAAAGRARATGEQDEQRAQPLAAGGDRVAGVLGEHRAVPRGERHQAPLDLGEQLRHGSAGRSDDLRDGRAPALIYPRFVPACSAMMPPAVRM